MIESQSVCSAERSRALKPQNTVRSVFDEQPLLITRRQVMAAPVGSAPDWIELYNAGSQWVDLTGVLLGDSNSDNRFLIGQSSDCATLLPPRGFLVLLSAMGEVSVYKTKIRLFCDSTHSLH